VAELLLLVVLEQRRQAEDRAITVEAANLVVDPVVAVVELVQLEATDLALLAELVVQG
jgi:hypothetical protein